jgi:hypothetical protein
VLTEEAQWGLYVEAVLSLKGWRLFYRGLSCFVFFLFRIMIGFTFLVVVLARSSLLGPVLHLALQFNHSHTT